VTAQPTSGAALELAARLKELRETKFAGVRITQQALGRVLGGDKTLSAPLISSWEKGAAVPTKRWLAAYSTFFATERSVEGGELRMLRENELTASERAARDDLKRKLMSLRADATRIAASPSGPGTALGGLWHFRDGRPIRIVSPQVPEEQIDTITPEHPTLAYGKMYSYSSIDALIELFGHIRAANPRSDVRIRLESELEADDYSAHLVALGGVDWNPLTARTPELLPDFPVRQVSPGDDPGKSYFQIGEDDGALRFGPDLGSDGKILSDAGMFLRTPSPYNLKRTFTLCTAAYSLTTLGVVRALTDAGFRDRNEEYVRERFPRAEVFSILSRILVADGHEALTPDWSAPGTVLYEWPEVQ
jgi:hypothetical protein